LLPFLELLKTEIDQILPVFLWHPVLLFKKGIWFRYRTLGIAACKRSGGIAIVNVREEADLNKKGGIMFSRLFGKPKEEPNTLSTLDKLNEVSASPACYNRLLIRFSRFFSLLREISHY
jgi:hypothetical protein